MGSVYRARDTRLNRTVAIKVSQDQFSERFEREAQLVAQLNHPNVCTLHDVGPNYLVMEFVDGPTLADRMSKGPMPLEEALPIARQMADAIEAAHEKGIIHRDLKPENVKLTADGAVKVLDFGLAKAAEIAQDPGTAPTIKASASLAGFIVGTPAYMSPEQAAGKPVDKRTDIWAYGVVLWEMVTGKRLFEGETVSHTLAAVLTQPPDLSAVPAPLRPLLARCLVKDAKARMRDIGEARLMIESGLPTVAEPVAPVVERTPRVWIALAATLALALLGVAWLHFREAVPERRVMRFQILPPEETQFGDLAMSPDGRRIAFVTIEAGKTQLWIRPFDSLTAQPLPGTEGASFPFWSPDSRFLAFFADNKLKKIDLSGGPPQTLCDTDLGPRGGSWSKDGVILFSRSNSSPLFRVPADGGEAKAATTLSKERSQTSHRWPHFLPGGKHYLYFARGVNVDAPKGIFLGTLDSSEAVPLLDDYSPVEYTESSTGEGFLLFVRSGNLMAQPFHRGRLKLTGGPFPVVEQVANSSTSRAQFSIAGNGILVFSKVAPLSIEARLAWFDRSGKRLNYVGETGILGGRGAFALSPDGENVVLPRPQRGSQGRHLWRLDLARDVMTRMTFGDEDDWDPVWSPDGARIAYSHRNGKGAWEVRVRMADGSGKDETLLTQEHAIRISDWSRDGRFLLYYELNPKSRADIWVMPLTGARKPVLFLQTPFDEGHAIFSPDGKWIAYDSTESGTDEVYVQPFPATGAKWQISKSGGARSRWRADGKELFFRDEHGKLFSVDIKTGSAFEAGTPKGMFRRSGRSGFAVTSDGQRFLMPASDSSDEEINPATVVVNWLDAVRR
ncbi:MAG: serine/threonine-protein kinase [Acidobacteria bacterium]|nr:serine/threonine-protein kinase [Acidobacteriota bacterium]